MIRTVNSVEIEKAVAELCIQANKILPQSLCSAIENAQNEESSPLCKSVLGDLLCNIDAAKELDIPVCQDTGMAVVFLDIGQDVHIEGDLPHTAVNKGVAKGYTDGLLRASIVSDPLRRVNSRDNTPAVVHTRIVEGDRIKITVAPKGFGSENMSKITMLKPSAEREDVIKAVTDMVSQGGSNPCPPIVVGVGIGGDFEYAAYLSKLALCRDISQRNSDEYYCKMEADMLESINRLNIGAMGFKGDVTALAVNIEQYPTHIAGLPVAVNIGCHVTRHAEKII